MPDRNSMGPLGEGPRTGRGMGKCKTNTNQDDTSQFGQGRGMGNGRRAGRGMQKGMNQRNGVSILQRLESLEKTVFNKD